MTKRRPAGEVEIAGDSSSSAARDATVIMIFFFIYIPPIIGSCRSVIAYQSRSGDSMICSRCRGSTMTSLSFLPVNRARMCSFRICASYTVPSSPKRWRTSLPFSDPVSRTAPDIFGVVGGNAPIDRHRILQRLVCGALLLVHQGLRRDGSEQGHQSRLLTLQS